VTQTTELERDCLARHAAGKKMLAEIGVFHGVTTRRLRSVMDPQGTLVAIDPFPKQRLGFSAYRLVAHREVSRIKRGNVKWMRTTGALAAKELKADYSRSFDFLFIDGDHSWEGIKGDWEGWRDLIATGGIVALHDSRLTPLRPLEGTGSFLFVQQVISKDPSFDAVDGVDSLTVFKRSRS
jgi:predicted O-methyltransferase YrrM